MSLSNQELWLLGTVAWKNQRQERGKWCGRRLHCFWEANGVLFSCLYQASKNEIEPATRIRVIELVSDVLTFHKPQYTRHSFFLEVEGLVFLKQGTSIDRNRHKHLSTQTQTQSSSANSANLQPNSRPTKVYSN